LPRPRRQWPSLLAASKATPDGEFQGASTGERAFGHASHRLPGDWL
jgi:hypothetical protein